MAALATIASVSHAEVVDGIWMATIAYCPFYQQTPYDVIFGLHTKMNSRLFLLQRDRFICDMFS